MGTKNTTINPDDNWVEIETTGSGELSASKAIEYCKAAATPSDDLLGHHLKTMDTVYWDLADTEILYARTKYEEDVTVVSTGS